MTSNIKQRMVENSRIYKKSTECKFPKNMLLETTNICNHTCLMCANSKGTKKRGIIDNKFAKRILKEAYDLGTREVGFYGMGEPLLDSSLEEYIVYAKSLGYGYIYITTNGALLTQERAKTLIEAGIDSIKFSINAANAKDYSLIHGKDEFDLVIQNLIYLDSLRKKQNRNISLYISYIVTRYTASDKDGFRMAYQKYVDDIVFVDCRTSGDMADEINKYLSVNQKMEAPFENNVCPMIFNKLHITYEGFLSMCCDDLQNYLIVADLNKESLESAWNNQYACDLRQRHLEHDLTGTRCFNCMNNCNKVTEPLNAELAVFYDSKSWSKEDEIKKRIDMWKSL